MENNVNLEYHKGEICIVDNKTFCQEGYCSGCELFKRGESSIAMDNRYRYTGRE